MLQICKRLTRVGQKSMFTNGQVKELFHIKDGKRDQIGKNEWFENGQIKVKRNFKNDVMRWDCHCMVRDWAEAWGNKLQGRQERRVGEILVPKR